MCCGIDAWRFGNIGCTFAATAMHLSDPCCLQVCCGAYHSAALSADGRLFTWGDGLCGKLGHGDLASCSEPRQVEVLGSHRVLGVACGTWHTACIATQRPPDDGAGGTSGMAPLVRANSSAGITMQHVPPTAGQVGCLSWEA